MITPKQIGHLKELAAHHMTLNEDSAAIIAALNDLSALRSDNAALLNDKERLEFVMAVLNRHGAKGLSNVIRGGGTAIDRDSIDYAITVHDPR